jgi:hypothetical protein
MLLISETLSSESLYDKDADRLHFDAVKKHFRFFRDGKVGALCSRICNLIGAHGNLPGEEIVCVCVCV